MEVLYPRCCGLDVHKSSITACVLIAQSSKPQRHIRRFGCTTRELRELVVWLHEFGVEHVAMESTGVYWKPVWNVLESHFQIVLANAQHIKAVPGRKTDVKDCQWIAELLRHGLLRRNTLGKSGRAILTAIIGGEENCERLADLALGHLRAKIPQLRQLSKAKCVIIIAFFCKACFANCPLSKLKSSY